MFIFEGFGSFFPYLIYLSLIWICLIFGFKAQIVEIFHIPFPKNQSVSLITLSTNNASIIQYNHTSKIEYPDKDTDSMLLSGDDFKFLTSRKFNRWGIKNFNFTSFVDIFNLFSRRGPPA
jgi:hypothetical protein